MRNLFLKLSLIVNHANIISANSKSMYSVRYLKQMTPIKQRETKYIKFGQKCRIMKKID